MLSVCAAAVNGSGGPTLRRRAKEGEIAISLAEGEEGREILREGKNLNNVFPFVGGNRGRSKLLVTY